jgi:hypothetical protein
MSNFQDDYTQVNSVAVEEFIPINDLHPRGLLPWKRSRILDMIKQGALPEPATFGPKLRGCTLRQIQQIQRQHLRGA